ncbi:hypothetical protein MRM75_12220 [bacterium 19CA06SA08-2]|uniref:Uncharacterized protein n=1 Tax=bacterium 19CA06SA08-2 TaxID=2920658 RepID=A0AAU6U050_UNCXX
MMYKQMIPADGWFFRFKAGNVGILPVAAWAMGEYEVIGLIATGSPKFDPSGPRTLVPANFGDNRSYIHSSQMTDEDFALVKETAKSLSGL